MESIVKPQAAVLQSDQRVVLHNISWGTYERLLEELSDQSAPRLLYNQGTLHLMSPSYEHGVLVDIISDLLKRLVEESDLEIVGFTPVTFKREDIERGFEPDAGFFIQNAARMVGKKTLNLSVEPPPDLILEVDLTVDSSENLPIYGSFGIPEVWLHDGRRMSFYAWTGQKYRIIDCSATFPWLSSETMSQFIDTGLKTGRIQLLKQFGAWVREQKQDPNA